jgi:hypothetical protein
MTLNRQGRHGRQEKQFLEGSFPGDPGVLAVIFFLLGFATP